MELPVLTRPLGGPSPLEARLAAGEFVVASEVSPPRRPRLTGFIRRARRLGRFAVALTVTNNHAARPRLESLVAAYILRLHGIDPIWVVNTRDRNRLAISSQILAAGVLGVQNVLCVKGDPIEKGPDPEAKAVHDLSTLDLIRLFAEQKAEGHRFFVGAAVDVTSGPAEKAFRQARRRVEAGADFIQTQPVFELGPIAELAARLRDLGERRPYLIAGLMPVLDVQDIGRVERNLGIPVPASVRERLARASDPRAAGLELLTELVAGLRRTEGIHGVNVMLFDQTDHMVEGILACLGHRAEAAS